MMKSPEKTASTRLFWQGRDSPSQKQSENQAPYDPEAPPSPSRRPSLEKLKRASRVKNSHMFREWNPEYDPAQVYVPQRPLAPSSPQKNGENGEAPQENDSNDGGVGPRPPSPSKDQGSPAKSSLSKASRFGAKGTGFDPENEIWSDHRHAKSVTFDAAPPQINEYEMTTPDPSSAASDSRDGSYESEEEDYEEGDISFDRESSGERDDSFDASLEDTEKTPVVLPEDWRYMTPSNANDGLSNEGDDPFMEDEDHQGHSPDPRPSSRQEAPAQHSRVESLDSNGEPRPLPPLPSVHKSSPSKFTTALELASGGQRVLPSPPAPATCSKEDIAEFSNTSMSLEERLRLMMIQDDKKDENPSEPGKGDGEPGNPDDKQPQSDGEAKQTGPDETKNESEKAAEETEVFSPPRISRDSILRDLRKGDNFMEDDSDIDYDPDVPIPSLENDYDDYDDDDDTNSVVIKEEEDDNDDLYDIPEYYENVSSKDSSYRDLKGNLPHDESSSYSFHSSGPVEAHPMASDDSEDRQPTPVPTEPVEEVAENKPAEEAQKEPEQPRPSSALDMSAIRETLQRPTTPENKEEHASEPSTPDSVIHHSVDGEEEEQEENDIDDDASVDESVPAPIATVKAHGVGLKTRPSLTPADMESMAATRRIVSGSQAPPVPSLSKQNSDDSQHSGPDDAAQESAEKPDQLAPPSPSKDSTKRQPSLVKLDIPFSIQEESLGFGLDKEFDRVMENQKVEFELALSKCSAFHPPVVMETQEYPFISALGPKDPTNRSQPKFGTPANQHTPKQRGYLMRQNTKVIVASSHNEDDTATTPGEAATEARASRTPGNTTRKPSQQTWTTVPWNSQRRRSSMRTPSGIPKKKPAPGAVPPLPGQKSNVQEPAAPVEEPEPVLNEALEEGEERGRLFVKVVGIKYMDLPLPKGRCSSFWWCEFGTDD